MNTESLDSFRPFSQAEEILIGGLGDGKFDRLADGALPETDDPDRIIRAALLRFLILGGPAAPATHEKGIRISGAHVSGVLDLEGCRIPRDIGLVDCRFDGALVLRSAVIDTLYLDGSVLPSLLGERLETRGDVYLRSATLGGPMLLPGARIGGSIVADGARFAGGTDLAIAAPGLEMRGSVLLRGATVDGGVDLTNARLHGDLEAIGARIEHPHGAALLASGLDVRGDILLQRATLVGSAKLDGARCGGDLDLSGGAFTGSDGLALAINRATVGGAFILRDGTRIEGLLSLNGTTLGLMVDDRASWPAPGDLALNRCLYGAFLASPADAKTRLEWLGLQQPARFGEDFWPQPYERLAAVLFDMGHNEDAQQVLFEKERLQRRARRARANTRAGRAALGLVDALLRVTLGYGRRPALAFLWLGAFWIAGAGLLEFAWVNDAMRPNVPFVLRSPEWMLCELPAGQELRSSSLSEPRAGLSAPGQSQLDCFLAQPEAASFPKFNPWMYAVDALLPAVDTGQRSFWSPDTRMPIGAVAKGFTYTLTIAGWALGLLAVAGFSGLVRSR